MEYPHNQLRHTLDLSKNISLTTREVVFATPRVTSSIPAENYPEVRCTSRSLLDQHTFGPRPGPRRTSG